MNVLNYIATQRRKISEKHLGETYLCGRGGTLVIARDAREILAEMDRLEGLNVRERSFYRVRRRSLAN